MQADYPQMLRSAAMRPVAAASKAILDSAKDKEPSLSGADDYTIKDIKMAAAAAVQEWAETDDLDEGESFADRLLAQIVGIADENKDGDITEEEQAVLDVALNSAFDYLVKLGVTEEDAGALLNDWDAAVAERVRELVASELPDGEDAALEALDEFVFSEEDQEPVLDAVYRKKVVVRGGKKVRINKRVSGKVRLSAKQKASIRKAQRKAHSAGARMRRMKSMKIRARTGL